LPFDAPAAIVASATEWRASMGDKSPKSKQRGQKQKNAAKVAGAADARSKQDNQSRAPLRQK
jgi:hypothetical protein